MPENLHPNRVRLDVYDPNRPKDKLILKLCPMGDVIKLCAVDAVGNTLEGGVILTIQNDGKMIRARGVSVHGITLDGQGRIVEVDNDEVFISTD